MNKTELVMSALAEAVPYARTCCSGKIRDDELTSICYEAMTKCAERYSPKRGKFFAFCKPRIRGALLRYWNTTGAVVRNAECVPLAADCEKDDSCFVPEEASEEPDFDRIDFHERWAQVSKVLARVCTDRECAILQLVYSMNFTFEETGKRFDISRAAAQAIAAKCIERIKKMMTAK
jgi:RNA polymerase sigma factor (sigma-70 family)